MCGRISPRKPPIVPPKFDDALLLCQVPRNSHRSIIVWLHKKAWCLRSGACLHGLFQPPTMATPGLVPSNQLLPCLLSLSAAALACVLLYRRWKRISIDQLPGPQPQSFLLGNLGQFYRGEAAEADFAWQQEFGHVLRIKGAIGTACSFLIQRPYTMFTIPDTLTRNKRCAES